MYGFGGVGQLEVRFIQMLPQRDDKERQSYSANGPWKAEMSNINTYDQDDDKHEEGAAEC